MAARTDSKTGEAKVEPRVEQEKIYVSWTAPARPHRKIEKQAMSAPMVIAGLVGVILLVAGEWMLLMVVASMVFAYYAWSMIPAEMIGYQITSRGVRIGSSLYEWPMFTRWWIGEKWGQNLLFIETPQGLAGQIALLFNREDKEKIEKTMTELLLKEKPAETGLDRAAKWMTEKFPLTGSK